MLSHDPLEKLRFLHIGETLIVEDDVVALRPTWLGIDRHLVVGAVSPFVDNRGADACPRGEPTSDDRLLGLVIVAAATGDIEHLERLARLNRGRRASHAAGCGQEQKEGHSWQRARKATHRNSLLTQKRRKRKKDWEGGASTDGHRAPLRSTAEMVPQTQPQCPSPRRWREGGGQSPASCRWW